MKNLANCKPSEFLRQTNRIRKKVKNWLDITKVLDIWRTKPNVPEGTSEEKENKMIEAQVKENINGVFDSIMEDHPDETLELLGLLCFVEPEDVDNYEVTEYLESFNDLIKNKAVVDFFISLIRLANTDI